MGNMRSKSSMIPIVLVLILSATFMTDVSGRMDRRRHKYDFDTDNDSDDGSLRGVYVGIGIFVFCILRGCCAMCSRSEEREEPSPTLERRPAPADEYETADLQPLPICSHCQCAIVHEQTKPL